MSAPAMPRFVPAQRLVAGQRVRVHVAGACQARRESVTQLAGYTGRVDRLRPHDDGAWVRMERELPEGAAYFPRGDVRHQDTLLFPEECEVIG